MDSRNSLPLTPKQKLAASRAELLEAMGYHDVAPTDAVAPQLVSTRDARNGIPSPRPTTRRGVLARWWSRHPLHSVVDLGRPFLEDMAERAPGKLMAYGAGTTLNPPSGAQSSPGPDEPSARARTSRSGTPATPP